MSEPSAQNVVELRGVSRSYGGLTVLHSLDLTVPAGAAVAIVGPSGSGKTTLLQIMGTLDRPSAGTVLVAGADVTRMSDRELSRLRARHIGFVFQQFFLSPTQSAVDNVATGLLYTGTRAASRRRRAEAALERVGLGHRLSHRPGELSGGERQRVAIARAVVGEPSLLLADEPTGNLDSRAGAGIVALLHELHAEGATIVLITHDADVAATMPVGIHLRDGAIMSGPDEARPHEWDFRAREWDFHKTRGSNVNGSFVAREVASGGRGAGPVGAMHDVGAGRPARDTEEGRARPDTGPSRPARDVEAGGARPAVGSSGAGPVVGPRGAEPVVGAGGARPDAGPCGAGPAVGAS